MSFKQYILSIVFFWFISIPFKNALYQLSTFIILLSGIIYIVKQNKLFDFIEKLKSIKDLLYTLFFILFTMTISNLFNDITTINTWKEELIIVLRFGIVFLILYYLMSINLLKTKHLIIFGLISLTLQAFDGIYQAIFLEDFFKNTAGSLESGLTGGTFNRNIFGMLMGIGILISFYLLLQENISKLLSINLLFLFFTMTLFSYSRAVWVALAISFGLYFILNVNKVTKKSFLYGLISVFMIAIFFIFYDPLQYRLEQLINGNSSRRFEIWLHTLDLIKEKLWIGYGLDAWKYHALPGGFAATHNNTLTILLYTGILGLVAWSILLIKVLKKVIINKNNRDILLMSVIYLFIDAQFDQDIFGSKIFTSILFILLLVIYDPNNDNIKNKRRFE